jgi:hypothetical protein
MNPGMEIDGRKEEEVTVRSMFAPRFGPWRMLTCSQKARKHQKTEDRFSISIAIARQECRGFGRRRND